MTWAIYYLGTTENEWLRRNIAREGRQLHERGCTPETLADMRYTRAALCEAMRLRPPSYAVDRVATRDTQLPEGVRVARGDVLLISPFAMHMNDAVFPEPERFDARRFLSKRSDAALDPWSGGFGRDEYMPFSLGHRRCIGERFAKWEMLIVLSTLTSMLEITRDPKAIDVPYDPSKLAMKPTPEGVHMYVRRRS